MRTGAVCTPASQVEGKARRASHTDWLAGCSPTAAANEDWATVLSMIAPKGSRLHPHAPSGERREE